eukprot:TRINITY_DN4398_c0_g1_i1.p1 TRINITY_DN4398_c0_g1~~TRINITY_DN4398_c0_g1_i1.p1  ORF type:complete len:196 (-),score=42.19 TRINITY_DN4398_c0_g1_i1:30-617(-)
MGCLGSKERSVLSAGNSGKFHVSSENSTDIELKIIVVGPPGVGKTSLMIRYVDDEFFENPHAPLLIDSVSIKTKEIIVGDVNVSIKFTDTGGIEKVRALTTQFYRGAHGIILLYDVTDRSSWEQIPRNIQESDRKGNGKIIVAGNKTDLLDHQVESSELEKLATELSFPYAEVSAKTGEGIDNLITTLVQTIIET